MSEIRVKVAEIAASKGNSVLVTLGLGSCVAIVLYDDQSSVGGMAHILLPSETMARERGTGGKFPGTAVPLLLERMRALGADERNVTARIAGGASMFAALVPANAILIGERNVLATRLALERARIPLLAQDVGGQHGRSVFLRLADGQVTVRSIQQGDVRL